MVSARRGGESSVPEELSRWQRWTSPKLRLGIGLALVMVAWAMIFAADNGLQVRRARPDGTPMRFVRLSPERMQEAHLALHGEEAGVEEAHPEGRSTLASMPGVIVVHGYAGSGTLMQPYAHVLARAGYGVLLLDLPGHGDNPRPMSAEAIEEALDAAWQELARQPEVDPERIAILGHSLGAGAALTLGYQSPERYAATVAISPVAAEVSAGRPRNLQLQAGGWESVFRERAEVLLELAGGASREFAAGTARELAVVPAAEHMTILFRDASHVAAREWLDAALGTEPLPGRESRDRRILWWLAHLVGTMLFVSSLAPQEWRPPAVWPKEGPWGGWLAFLVAPFAATAACWALAQAIDLSRLGGVALAPALGIWFLIAGSILLVGPFRLAPLRGKHLIWGLGVFGFLWLALGASAEMVWMSWGLESRRWLLWPLLSLASIPWFAGMVAVRHQARGSARFVWWIAESALLVSALWLLAKTVPELGLLAILVPLLPLYLGFLAVVSGRVNDAWAAGIGCGLFWGWLLVAAFPIVS